jgi:hypothetical protein
MAAFHGRRRVSGLSITVDMGSEIARRCVSALSAAVFSTVSARPAVPPANHAISAEANAGLHELRVQPPAQEILTGFLSSRRWKYCAGNAPRDSLSFEFANVHHRPQAVGAKTNFTVGKPSFKKDSAHCEAIADT